MEEQKSPTSALVAPTVGAHPFGTLFTAKTAEELAAVVAETAKLSGANVPQVHETAGGIILLNQDMLFRDPAVGWTPAEIMQVRKYFQQLRAAHAKIRQSNSYSLTQKIGGTPAGMEGDTPAVTAKPRKTRATTSERALKALRRREELAALKLEL